VLANVVWEVVEKQRHVLAGKPVEVEVHANPELVLPASASPWSSVSATAMAGRCGWKAASNRERRLKSVLLSVRPG
jgi:hypothetical protein